MNPRLTLKKFSNIFILLALLIGFSAPAIGATYYVDNSGHPACSNNVNYGTESLPWCTLNYAASRIIAGDTIYIKAGTYNEAAPVIQNLTASEGNETRIENYQDDVVTIRSSGYGGGRVVIDNTDYLIWDGINVTFGNYGIEVRDTSSYVTIRNSEIYDIGQQGIFVHENSHHVTIDSCKIHNTDNYTSNGEGIYIGSATGSDATHDITVSNNEIYDVGGEGVDIKCYTYNVIVDGNNIHDIKYDATYCSAGCSGVHVYADGSPCSTRGQNPNHIIRNNFIHDFTSINNGISLRSGATVYNNVLWDGGKYAFLSQSDAGDSYQRKIYHNTVDTSSMSFIGTSYQTDIKNNTGYSSGTGNIAFNSSYFVSVTEGSENYRLVSGASPINYGNDLTATVSTDIEGTSRSSNGNPDAGAYEYKPYGVSPSAPKNLRIITAVSH